MDDVLNAATGGRLLFAVAGVGLAFVLLIIAIWLIRGRRGPAPFLRGGRNRQPRLQVLDAAAVDTRRRLVLVRRDNVEHLIMIGGPTDIVIESGIGAAEHAMPHPAQLPQPASRAALPEPAAIVPTQIPNESRLPPAVEQRAVPMPRPVPAEPRVEPVREAIAAPRETARPVPGPAAAVPPVAAEPQQAAIHVVPVVAPVVTAPAVESAARQAPEVKPESLRPIAALAAANAAARPADSVVARPVDNSAARPADSAAAVDLLEAARSRVFQETPEPRIVPVTPGNVPPALQPAAENPKQLGSDFEQILEQEMANNLAARETAALGAPVTNRQLPPRDPNTPRVTGATREPSLQAEVARIFGEMSVGNDK